MERGSGKAPYGTNYPYYKICMSVYLPSINSCVWDIFLDLDYVVLGSCNGQEQIDQHKANSKARNALFSCLWIPKFEQNSNLDTSHEICSTLRDIS